MTTPTKIARPLEFQAGDMIVYPAHGIGRITDIEEQEIAGFRLELFVVFVEKDKLTLRVPTAKAGGMRRLAEPALVERALEVLTGRARLNRTMWSRRAAAYQAKINSGDLIALAEVVRDLHRSPVQPEASYGERGLYDSALEMLWREISTVNNITATEALTLIQQNVTKAPRSDSGATAEVDTPREGGQEEAA